MYIFQCPLQGSRKVMENEGCLQRQDQEAAGTRTWEAPPRGWSQGLMEGNSPPQGSLPRGAQHCCGQRTALYLFATLFWRKRFILVTPAHSHQCLLSVGGAEDLGFYFLGLWIKKRDIQI